MYGNEFIIQNISQYMWCTYNTVIDKSCFNIKLENNRIINKAAEFILQYIRAHNQYKDIINENFKFAVHLLKNCSPLKNVKNKIEGKNRARASPG